MTKRFLLVAVGSVGDVYPYLGIGQGLRRRGHAVAVIANPYYEAVVRQAGLDLLPVGTTEQQQELLSHPKAWHLRTGWKIWLRLGARRPLRAIYETIAAAYVPGATVVATSWGGLGARVAQDHLGVPMATLHLEPDKLRRCHEASVMPAPLLMGSAVPALIKRWEYWLADKRFVDRILAGRINDLRAELGLKPVRRVVHEWWHSPQRVVGLFPPWWANPQPDWPPQTVLTDFPFWDDSGEAQSPTEIERFLDPGPALVVFSPGAINQQAGRFFETAVDACRRIGCRGILLTKHKHLLPAQLPADICHLAYAPFSSVLPRAAVLVHHAGIGTSAQCLRAGIPQLVTPLMRFYRDTAGRLLRLGVAASVRPSAASGTTMARALENLLTSGPIADACRQVSARLVNNRGIEETCDLLEALIGTVRPLESEAGLDYRTWSTESLK